MELERAKKALKNAHAAGDVEAARKIANAIKAQPPAQEPRAEPEEGLARTVFDQSMQGATFGFADEVTDRLGAGMASLATGQPYGELLEDARDLTSERQQRQFEQRPVTSVGANIAGGILTGGAGATTKAGGAVGNFIRGGDAGARIAKGSGAGAASGALYGAGAGEDGNRLEGAQSGAIYGAAGGAAIPVAISGARKLNTKTIIPNADKIREQAGKLYQRADQKGGTFKPEFVDDFLVKAERSLLSDDDVIRAMKANKPLADAFEDLSLFRSQPMSLQRAQALDEQLGDMITSNMDMGRPNSVGKKLIDVQSTLREMIEGADDAFIEGGREGFEALKEGRKLWATSRRLEDIERIIQRAEMTDNPATAIRTGFRTLYNNPKRMRGFNKAERKAIEKAANQGIPTDILRIAGSRLNPIAATAVGGPLPGMAAAAGSMASRGGATRLQLNRAANAANTTAGRAGMTRQEPRSKLLARLLKQELPNNSNPETLAALLAQ